MPTNKHAFVKVLLYAGGPPDSLSFARNPQFLSGIWATQVVLGNELRAQTKLSVWVETVMSAVNTLHPDKTEEYKQQFFVDFIEFIGRQKND